MTVDDRPASAWRLGKRTIDLVAGFVVAVATLPLLLMCLLASAIVLRTWPLFVQTRLGEGGRVMRMPKVRTLPRDFPAYALKPEVVATRLPTLMRLLRHHKLDELPQLWLVVLGRLSLVGPRPKMPDGHEPVDREYGARRVLVPQGCTCLWQISDQVHLLPSQAPEFDLYYVDEGTVRLDLWILWRTALLMLGIAGPVGLGDVPAWTRRGTSVAWMASPVD